MRKRVYFGNWKMKLGYQESLALAKQYLEVGVGELAQQNKLIFAAVSYLPAKEIVEIFANSGINVAAQNCSVMNTAGAYTGEVSAAQLAEIGIKGVLVGHSERREIAGETDEMINKKVLNGLDSKLYTCLCIGESYAEREAGQTAEVIDRQLSANLAGIENHPNTAEYLVIGYEPIWAISSTAVRKDATAADVVEIMSLIRNWIVKKLGSEVGNNIPLLYGGSANPDNAQELIAIENVDGFIPGKASLTAIDFKNTIAA